jgi:hypothetical protein
VVSGSMAISLRTKRGPLTAQVDLAKHNFQGGSCRMVKRDKTVAASGPGA